MRISFLMPSDDLSGGNRVVATYARRLQDLGHEVLVVSNAADRPGWRDRLRAWRRGERAARAARAAGPRPPGHVGLSGVPHRVLERPRPIRADDLPDADVIVATWWETARWMHAMPAGKGAPLHLIQGYEVWGGPARREQVHATLRLPNHKVAISEGLKRTLQAELGDLDVAVVPNAIDSTQFDAPPRRRGSPPTVGFVHGVAPLKAASRYWRAVELARRELPELQVLAFGAEAPLPSQPLPLSAGTRFVLRPAQSQLASLYAGCDAWLFASRVDSFGLPVLEAMACRTPVIAVPVGAAPQLLADGAGVLLEEGSGDADDELVAARLAAELVALCRRPESDWQAMSARAHARAHAWTWADATEQLLREMSRAAARSR